MCTLLNMNLTSTTPRQIIPRLEDSVFRLGAAHPACTPNSESSISRSEGYFQDYAALPYFPPNEDQPISLCLFKPWNLLDLHGLVFYFILIIFEALHFILFLSPPPTLGGGTYAIIGRRSRLKFYIHNLHTWILFRQKSGPWIRTRSGYHVRVSQCHIRQLLTRG